MAIVTYKNVGITALAACVPRHVIDNYHYDLDLWPEEEVMKVVDKVGVAERRFADEKTCASDLCFAAAERLIVDNSIDRSEIDLVVFLSQTPDYRMPATSILLQDRLGLPMSTMAFDISLGCSGFISALSIVYAMMQNNGFRKALLLDGETRSKVYSRKDRREAFIFGDAGVAALIVEVPKDIKRLMAASGEDIQKMDYYVFHQANAFINNYIARKMKLDAERIPWTIQKYGNAQLMHPNYKDERWDKVMDSFARGGYEKLEMEFRQRNAKLIRRFSIMKLLPPVLLAYLRRIKYS